MPTKAQPRKPSFEVIDDVIHYTSKAGHKLLLDLDFPGDTLKEAMAGEKSEEEQFEIVAKLFGDNFQDAYNEMGALERTRLLRSFFVEFQKAASMPLGESVSSSDS
jgi:hypothetical protein